MVHEVSKHQAYTENMKVHACMKAGAREKWHNGKCIPELITGMIIYF